MPEGRGRRARWGIARTIETIGAIPYKQRVYLESDLSLLRLEGILVAEQPESIVIEHLRGLRGDIGDIKGEMRTLKSGEMATKSDLHSLRADVASDMLTMQKDTREQIVGLRRAVIEYHSAVVGHGLIISELEERVRRLEQHLKLPSLERG